MLGPGFREVQISSRPILDYKFANPNWWKEPVGKYVDSFVFLDV